MFRVRDLVNCCCCKHVGTPLGAKARAGRGGRSDQPRPRPPGDAAPAPAAPHVVHAHTPGLVLAPRPHQSPLCERARLRRPPHARRRAPPHCCPGRNPGTFPAFPSYANWATPLKLGAVDASHSRLAGLRVDNVFDHGVCVSPVSSRRLSVRRWTDTTPGLNAGWGTR